MQKHAKWTSKVCGALLIAACSLGLAYVVGEMSGVTFARLLSEGTARYENADLKFSMKTTSAADISATLEPSSTTTSDLGRVGGVGFAEAKAGGDLGTPTVSVLVYTTAQKLEKDQRSGGTDERDMDDVMADNGLVESLQTIDGLVSSVYAGTHIVDGVGGEEYEYVAAEVSGPTYAYLIQFYNMGTDPMSDTIQSYLQSFDAK